MATNNYFKVTPTDGSHSLALTKFVFFDQNSREAVAKAFAQAQTLGKFQHFSISVWKMPWHEGPWCHARVVGESPAEEQELGEA